MVGRLKTVSGITSHMTLPIEDLTGFPASGVSPLRGSDWGRPMHSTLLGLQALVTHG